MRASKGSVCVRSIQRHYCGLRGDADFSAFLAGLAAAELQGLSKSELYAVYVNAYDACAFDAVLQGAPRSTSRGIATLKT